MIILKNDVKPWDVWHHSQHSSLNTDLTFHVGQTGEKFEAHSRVFVPLSSWMKTLLDQVKCHCVQLPCYHESPHLNIILDGFASPVVKSMLELVYVGSMKASMGVLEDVGQLLMEFKIELNTTWMDEDVTLVSSSDCHSTKATTLTTSMMVEDAILEDLSECPEDQDTDELGSKENEDEFSDDQFSKEGEESEEDVESPRKVLQELEGNEYIRPFLHPTVKQMHMKSCHFCDKKFKNSRDLKNHLCLHLKDKILKDYSINSKECKICGLKEKQLMRLASHIGYKHDKLKEYISLRDQPEVHQKAVSLDKTIITKMLQNVEYGKEILKKELSEIDQVELPCNLCGKLHHTKHRRMKHIGNHFGAFLLKHFPHYDGNVCTICGKDLSRGSSLSYHLGFVHNGLHEIVYGPKRTTMLKQK